MRSLSELLQIFAYLNTLIDLKRLKDEIVSLHQKSESPTFWDNQKEAIRTSEELKKSEDLVSRFQHIEDNFALLTELNEEDTDYNSLLKENDKSIANLELELQFSEEFDNNDALVEIHPGAGGTESQDWAEMLLRMYLRFAENHDLKVRILDKLDGEEAGLKSVSFEVSGAHAYGLLKSEKGVHRLVRISPFDSNKRRHTSFASVMVIPLINDGVMLDIPAKDLRIDTYRSQGAGGQNVNKVESAVRITHIPTGLVSASQSERSQNINRDIALKGLKSKLYELERAKQEEKIQGIVGGKSSIEWGSQIRSYVFAPYTLAKDNRTNYEEGDVFKVMEGNLDGFIKAYLAYIKGGKKND